MYKVIVYIIIVCNVFIGLEKSVEMSFYSVIMFPGRADLKSSLTPSGRRFLDTVDPGVLYTHPTDVYSVIRSSGCSADPS